MSEAKPMDVLERAKKVFRIESDAVLALCDKLDENFTKAIDLLYNTKRVVLTGISKPQLIMNIHRPRTSRYLKNSRCTTGLPRFCLSYLPYFLSGFS